MGHPLPGKVPMAADGAKIGVSLALDPGDQSGVNRVGLRAVAPLADTIPAYGSFSDGSVLLTPNQLSHQLIRSQSLPSG